MDSENLINHRSMNRGQFEDPHSFTCFYWLCGNIFVSYRRSCRFESPFLQNILSLTTNSVKTLTETSVIPSSANISNRRLADLRS